MVEGMVLTDKPVFDPHIQIDDMFIDGELWLYDYDSGAELSVSKEDCEIHIFECNKIKSAEVG